MEEIKIKRYFSPIWKLDKIEAELERAEAEGWRLDNICGFRKFRFVRSAPLKTKYFFTCSLAKERGMLQTELILKNECKATKIPGNFIEGLKTSSVFRIENEVDLLQRKIYRNLYLRHLVFQSLLIEITATLSLAVIIFSDFSDGKPLFDFIHILLILLCCCGAVSSLRHFYGWIYLRKQYRKFLESMK